MLDCLAAPTVDVMDNMSTLNLWSRCQSALRRWWGDEGGVTAIEYGLLAALIVVACVAAISAAGTSLTGMYNVWTSAVLAAI